MFFGWALFKRLFDWTQGCNIKLCCGLSDQQRADKLCSNLHHKIPPNETHLTYIYSNLSHSKNMLSLSYKLYMNSVYAHVFLKGRYFPFFPFFFISFKLLEGSARSLHTLILFELYSEKIILKLSRLAFDNLSHWETNLSGNFKALFAFRDAILQILVATSSCLTSCCRLTLSLNFIAYMHWVGGMWLAG